jgi:hypothetical protein
VQNSRTLPSSLGITRVMSLTLEDEMGLLEAVMFSEAKKGFAHVIYTSELLSLEGRLHC